MIKTISSRGPHGSILISMGLGKIVFTFIFTFMTIYINRECYDQDNVVK
jgi:hypothetical protein